MECDKSLCVLLKYNGTLSSREWKLVQRSVLVHLESMEGVMEMNFNGGNKSDVFWWKIKNLSAVWIRAGEPANFLAAPAPTGFGS